MSKAYKVIYYPTAIDDVRNILDYISVDNPPAASKLIEKIDKTVQSLSDFPLKGLAPKDSYLKAKQYRMLIIDSYIVFYIPNHNSFEVEIMRVLLCKQNYKFFL